MKQSSMSLLNLEFDSVESRTIGLSVREPITHLLEETLYEIISIIKPSSFLEIGAYEANFSADMKMRYPSCDCIAVEANPRVHHKFKEDASKADITYLNLAVGEENTTAKFYIPNLIAGKKMPHAGRMGSLYDVGLRDSETEQVDVPVTTLDNLLSDSYGDNICMWIDVEGALDMVLKGGKKALSRACIIYCELESSPVWKGQSLDNKIFDTLERSGFTAIARDCQKWFQYNVIFLRNDIAIQKNILDLSKDYTENAVSYFNGQRSIENA